MIKQFIARMFKTSPPVELTLEDSSDTDDVMPFNKKVPYTTDTQFLRGKRSRLLDGVNEFYFKSVKTMKGVDVATGNRVADFAMDSNAQGLSGAFALQRNNMPDAQLGWYASQGFIGYQTMALIAQNWLVAKACDMPARDAIRNGYSITFNDGEEEVNAEIIQTMKKLDRKYKIDSKMRDYINFGRVYGIRVAMFKIDFRDEVAEKEFYQNPFNADAVKPGSYKGIVEIDPYWLAPELDMASSSDPSSLHFYEPTWWRVSGGQRIHRSHLMIFINGKVGDVLKPNYLYGGVSVPQKIYERVYAAERTANEGPQLALTKRTNILKVDQTAVAAKPAQFESKLQQWSYFWSNYGIKHIGLDEEVQQLDTSLADLDAVIMTQYQIVAAIANVPATKLLGTSPKGFNATGEFEMEAYNQELESIQENDLTPFLDRHYMLMMKSDIEPKYGVAHEPDINWNPLDIPSAKEIAEINFIKAQTAQMYQDAGALDAEDIRNEVIADEDSGFNGMVDNEGLQDEDLAVVAGELLNGAGSDASVGMDAYDVAGKSTLGFFRSKDGILGKSQLITSQNYLDQNIVDKKIAAGDFAVQVSPEFKYNGKRYRMVIDGHHSFAGALQEDKMPEFIQWSAKEESLIDCLPGNAVKFMDEMKREGDYRNIVTRRKV